MNEKEAREIVGKNNIKHLMMDIRKAQGYLEAIEKAKGLVEALQEHTDDTSEHNKRLRCCNTCGFNYPCPTVMAREALTQWEKEK